MIGITICAVRVAAVAAFGLARCVAMVVTVLAAMLGAKFTAMIPRAMMIARAVFTAAFAIGGLRAAVTVIAITGTAIAVVTLRPIMTIRTSRTLLAYRPFAIGYAEHRRTIDAAFALSCCMIPAAAWTAWAFIATIVTVVGLRAAVFRTIARGPFATRMMLFAVMTFRTRAGVAAAPIPSAAMLATARFIAFGVMIAR